MKNIYLYLVLLLFAVGCNKESIEGPQLFNSKYLEGVWYITGRTGIYKFQGDTVSYKYDENVMGYEEHTIKLIQGKLNTYSISTKMRYPKQRDNESEEDYAERIENGQYSMDELNIISFESPSWIVSGNDIYIPGYYVADIEVEEKYLVSKIVKQTKNNFIIACTNPTISDYAIEGTPSFKYYMTFTRIR